MAQAEVKIPDDWEAQVNAAAIKPPAASVAPAPGAASGASKPAYTPPANDDEWQQQVNAAAGINNPAGFTKEPPAVQKPQAPQDQSNWRYPKMGASALAEGMVGAVGTPADADQGLAKFARDPNVPAWVHKTANFLTQPIDTLHPSTWGAGWREPSVNEPLTPAPSPTTEQMLEKTYKLGLTNRPELEPTGLGEHMLHGTLVGAGSAIPLMGAGAVAAGGRAAAGELASAGLGQVAKTGVTAVGKKLAESAPEMLTEGAGAGAGGEAVNAADPDAGGTARVLGTMAGALGGHGALSLARNYNSLRTIGQGLTSTETKLANSNKALADAKNAPTPAGEAKAEFNQYDVPNAQKNYEIQKETTDRQVGAIDEQAQQIRDRTIADAHSNANSQSVASDQEVHRVADAHARSAAGIDDPQAPAPLWNAQDTGEFAQKDARQWLTGQPERTGAKPAPGTPKPPPAPDSMPGKINAAFAPVDAEAGALPTGLDSFARAANSHPAGELNGLVDLLRPQQLPNRLMTRLDALQTGQQIGMGGPISWADGRQLKSALGNLMSDPSIVDTPKAAMLKRLYSGISEDLRSTLQEHNPALLTKFDDANDLSAHLYDVAKGPINKIINGPREMMSNDPTPGKIPKTLLNTGQLDGNALAALRQEVPKTVDALAAYHLRTEPGDWMPRANETNEQGLNRQARQALIPDPNHQTSVEQALRSQAEANAQRDAVTQQATEMHQHFMQGVKDRLSVHADQAKFMLDDAKDMAKGHSDAAYEEAKQNKANLRQASEQQATDELAARLARQKATAGGLGQTSQAMLKAVRSGFHGVQGVQVGGDLGASLGSAYGPIGTVGGRLAGAALGLAAPIFSRGVWSALKSPPTMASIATGGVAANALGGTRTKEEQRK